MTQAFPLQWPAGWPRTPVAGRDDGRHRFRRSDGSWTFGAARDALYGEFRKLGAANLVVSTNFEPGRYGEPVEGRRRPEDQAIAVYFTIAGKPLVMACDRFRRAEENMRSITLAVEAMRQLERHGGGHMMERAFSGFTALPAPDHWTRVLDLPANADRSQIESAYRAKAKAAHPDVPGGNADEMAKLNAARERAIADAA